MGLEEILFTIIIVLAMALIFKSFHHSFDKVKMHRVEMDLDDCQHKLKQCRKLCEHYEETILQDVVSMDEFTNKELESDHG